VGVEIDSTCPPLQESPLLRVSTGRPPSGTAPDTPRVAPPASKRRKANAKRVKQSTPQQPEPQDMVVELAAGPLFGAAAPLGPASEGLKPACFAQKCRQSRIRPSDAQAEGQEPSGDVNNNSYAKVVKGGESESGQEDIECMSQAEVGLPRFGHGPVKAGVSSLPSALKTPPTELAGAASVPPPLAPDQPLLVAAEVWAGVGTLSHCMQELGLPTGAFCERLPLESRLLAHNYPNALASTDFERGSWKSWPKEFLSRGQRCIALVGGVPCSSLSIAGPRKEQQDHRARFFVDTIDMAVSLGVLLLLIENVCELVTRDADHGIFSAVQAALRVAGFNCVVWMPRDADFGGHTQRKRVFLICRKLHLDCILPAIQLPTAPPPGVQALQGKLLPLDLVPADAWLEGAWEPLEGPLQPGKARLLGYITRHPSSVLDARIGDEVSLKTTPGWWIITDWLDDDRVELFLDVRARSKYHRCSRADIRGIRGRRVQVFDDHSVAITLRSFSVPPDFQMAFYDSRKPGVRALTGMEVWRLMELPERDAHWALGESTSDRYLGRMAGRAIPKSLALPAAKLVCDQVQLWDQAQHLERSWGAPIMHVDAEVGDRASLFIISFCGSTPYFLGPPAGWVFGRPIHESQTQDSIVAEAQHWANTALSQQRCECELAMRDNEAKPRHTVTMALVQFKEEQPWIPVSSLIGTKASLALEVAVKASSVVFGWAHHSVDLLRNGHFGTVPVRLVVPRPEYDCSPAMISQQQWNKILINDEKAVIELKCVLLRLAQETNLPKLAEWAQSAALHDTGDIPSTVRDSLVNFDPNIWRTQFFPRRTQFPPLTDWLPRPKPQPYQRRTIAHVLDFLLPDVKARFLEWQTDTIANVDSSDPIRNTPYVIGPSGAQPWVGAYDGVLWDCRRHATDGYIETLDCAAPISTLINGDLLTAEFLTKDKWPDQECLSFMVEGVQFKAGLPWQIVLCQHMESYRATADKVADEYRTHAGKGWFEDFSVPPYIPMRLIKRGSTERKNGGRPRPTQNSSWPHDDNVWDTDGSLVLSINKACGPKRELSEVDLKASHKRDSEGRPYTEVGNHPMPKEVKPKHGCVMQMMVVLVSAAAFLGEPLFVITDDAANYFNQFALAPSEYWQFVTLLKDSTTKSAVFMAEYVMGFGTRPSSNIAQRFADMIVELVMRRFSAEEKALHEQSADPKLTEWYQSRQLLSKGFNEAMLFFILMYTDDPLIAVVGVERTARFLLCWVRTLDKLGLIMASADKRQLGTGVIWCGTAIFSRGAIVIPLDKRLRALRKLHQLVDGCLSVGDLVSLTGLLEFCRSVLRIDVATMYGLYGPSTKTGESALGPATLVTASPLIKRRSKEWINRMAGACAAPVSAILSSSRSLPRGASVLLTSSDACKEGADLPGMGGYLAGSWWRYVYEERHMVLDIPVLELIAFALNLMVFGPFLEELLSPEDILVCQIDAKASPLILSDGRSKSLVMMFALDIIWEEPQIQRLKPYLAVMHVFGVGNKPADLASRSEVDALRRYASQVGVGEHELPSPRDRAMFWLDKIVTFSAGVASA